ncbi:excalibur calcium-binding domain-containing protein [uncultured Aquimarina sp.]|uniref:excalibur calcium-binding domain-containing protein n=1 Tax=uncultured Aquimarina sp. TaxID=575652 RepID=UPI00260B3A53|nr:excalibur calcium-binding domain-containing protein [uncultured Aquimarina sp.]
MKYINNIILILFVFLLLPLTNSCSESETEFDTSSDCRDTNCANYTSMVAAQAAFDADPECRNDLDRDNDGIACEEPGNSVRTCASTSNCGCSGKTKSQCQNDPCCKWIVGTGCKCN